MGQTAGGNSLLSNKSGRQNTKRLFFFIFSSLLNQSIFSWDDYLPILPKYPIPPTCIVDLDRDSCRRGPRGTLR